MRILIITILLVASLPTYAAIYKWTDNKGEVHYGDKPNGASGAKELNIDTSAKAGIMPEDAASDEKRQRILDAIQEDRQEKERQRKKDLIEREQRQRRCVYLRDRLRNIQAASGVYHLDDNGNRVFLSKEGRKESEASLQQQISKYCN